MIVGIDLGTTHSLIGVYKDGAPRLIPNALGQLLTPSVVSVDPDKGVLVGQAAHDRLITDPGSTVAMFKRWMGRERETCLGQRGFRPEELSALILRSLLDDARAELRQEITEAVISVPAYFGDAQRKATRAAGELAGIRVERLINEPTAAAVAYGLQTRADTSIFMVLDLGGGTFDVSILEIFDGIIQVHASAGDNHLGGEDFLQVLVNAFLQDNGLPAKKLKPDQLALLRRQLQAVKHRLSSQREAEAAVSLGDREYSWTIDEDRYADLSEPLIQRVRQPIERALRDAKLPLQRLDEVILVGGAWRMPLFTRTAARMIGKLPLRQVHPDEAIALGAAVVAGMKMRDESLEETVLTDVCPYTLGIGISRTDMNGSVSDGHFSPLIREGLAVKAQASLDRSRRRGAMDRSLRNLRGPDVSWADRRIASELLAKTADEARPRPLRRLMLMLVPGMPLRIREVLLTLRRIDPNLSHPSLNKRAIAFWDQANDRLALRRPRLVLALSRILVWPSSIFGLLMWLLPEKRGDLLVSAAKSIVIFGALWTAYSLAMIGHHRLVSWNEQRLGLSPYGLTTLLMATAAILLAWLSQIGLMLAPHVLTFSIILIPWVYLREFRIGPKWAKLANFVALWVAAWGWSQVTESLSFGSKPQWALMLSLIMAPLPCKSCLRAPTVVMGHGRRAYTIAGGLTLIAGVLVQ